MRRKIVFLGGLFPAEFSILKSFEQNNSDLYFLIDNSSWGQSFKTSYQYFLKGKNYIIFVDDNDLQEQIEKLNPDAIIHRLYNGTTYSFNHSYEIAKKLGIPLIKWCMETDYNDSYTTRFHNCDLAFFSHDTTFIQKLAQEAPINCYFFPYGVSDVETKLDNPKTKSFGTIGRFHSNIKRRIENIEMFTSILGAFKEKLYVHSDEWLTAPESISRNIIKRPQYFIENTTKIINQYDVIINIESISDLEGAYSHKLWQSMGCGIPVITNYRKCIENLFGPNGENLIYVENTNDIIYAYHVLLSNEKFRKELSERCYKFVHDEFDWYKRMESIFMLEKIWKK